jgi:hypothetical protein
MEIVEGCKETRSWHILNVLYTECHKRWHTVRTTMFESGRGGCGRGEVTQTDESTLSNDAQRGEADHSTLCRWVKQIVS